MPEMRVLVERLWKRRSRVVADSGQRPHSRLNEGQAPSEKKGPPIQELENPLGLTLLSEGTETKVDIVLVHGLGGGSIRTWCYNRDRALFWPDYLARDLNCARIMTFGYNADFASSQHTKFNVLDFAKQLLFQLQFSNVGFGKNPIIFVAHSMGGLVVKKAYLLALQDRNYSIIAKCFYGIIFLGTPHRGADNAQMLQNILRVSLRGPPKAYVDDLMRNSAMLQAINEEFRHVQENLKLVSFYETLKTKIGPLATMIVERDSAILGYREEFSAPFHADHHTICKFTSRKDEMYRVLLQCLEKFIPKYWDKDKIITQGNASKWFEVSHIEHIRDLSISSYGSIQKRRFEDFDEEGDLRWIQSSRLQGTCQWLFRLDEFQSWMSNKDKAPKNSDMMWLYGPPGCGKTTLASAVIEYMRESGNRVEFFFCNEAEKRKREVSSLLQSLATQLAKRFTAFRRELDAFLEPEKNAGSDARAIWQKVFERALSQISPQESLCLVLDALDECDNPSLLIQLLGNIRSPQVKILITSRYSDRISIAMNKAKIGVIRKEISPDDTKADISLFIQSSLENASSSKATLSKAADIIKAKAGGSFIWVRTVVESIQTFGHTQAGLSSALETVPSEMEQLYSRILTGFSESKTHSEKVKLVRSILKWTVFSTRPLHLDELQYAIEQELGSVTDLEDFIRTTCGNFITIDGRKRAMPFHLTARSFLQRNDNAYFKFDKGKIHSEIACLCLDFLGGSYLNGRLFKGQVDKKAMVDAILARPFALYAIKTWSEHLKMAEVGSGSSRIMRKLSSFFQSNVLVWVAILASRKQLGAVAQSAKNVQDFLSRSRAVEGLKAPVSSQELALDKVSLWKWSVDLLRVSTKFGKHLSMEPFCIFGIIPQYCPKESAIFQQARGSVSSLDLRLSLKVQGFNYDSWDDCIANIELHGHGEIMRMTGSGNYTALGYETGEVVILNSSTCQQFTEISCEPGLFSLQLNLAGDMMISASLQSVQVWNIGSGEMITAINPGKRSIYHAAFDKEDNIIMVTADSQRWFEKWSWKSGKPYCIDTFELAEDGDKVRPLNNGFLNSIAYSPVNRYLAIAYCGSKYPVSIWDTEQKCYIAEIPHKAHKDTTVSENTVLMEFDRVYGNLWLVYKDRFMLAWDASTFQTKECLVKAHCIACSIDGKTVATGDSSGIIKIWNAETLELLQQLSAPGDSISELCFNVDATRLFAIRGFYCTAWELKLSAEPSRSTLPLTAPPPYEKSLSPSGTTGVDLSSIKSLIVDRAGKTAFYGRRDGSLFSISLENLDRPPKLIFKNSHRITALALSPSGTFLAAASSGSITIYKLSTSGKTPVKVATKRIGSFISQALFTEEDTRLIVKTNGGCRCLDFRDLSTESTLGQAIFTKAESYWTPLPESSDDVLEITEQHINLHKCVGNKLVEQTSIALPLGSSNPGMGSRPIFKAAVHQSQRNGTSFILQLKSVDMSRPFSSISHAAANKTVIYDWIDGSSVRECKAFDRVERFVGVYENSIIFVDKDLWVCSWNICERPRGHTKHFFIPADLMDMDRALLSFTEVTSRGDFVFATIHGTLAVIKGGLQFRF